jgi:ribosome-associated translation inhibitor RaiA
MIPPLQVSYRNLEPTEELERRIRDEAAHLERFYDRIIGCRVMVEVPHEHREHGRHVHERVELVVPGGEIVAGREPSLHPALQQLDVPENQKRFEVQARHEHALVAVRDAFHVARRRLQDHVRRSRGDVKRHEPPAP